jgi:cyclin A
MALYISELAMLEYKMLHFLPSIIAAGCVYLARKILQHLDPWNWILEYYTTHTMMGLQTVAQQLYELVKAAPQHRCQAIHKKYSFPKFSSVSELAEIPVYFP